MADDRVDVPIGLSIDVTEVTRSNLKEVAQSLAKDLNSTIDQELAKEFGGNTNFSKGNKAIQSTFKRLQRDIRKRNVATRKAQSTVAERTINYDEEIRSARERQQAIRSQIAEQSKKDHDAYTEYFIKKDLNQKWFDEGIINSKSYSDTLTELDKSVSVNPVKKLYDALDEVINKEQLLLKIQEDVFSQLASTGEKTIKPVIKAYTNANNAQGAVIESTKQLSELLATAPLTDEFEKMEKQVTKLQTKLAKLAQKSQIMNKYGANDKSWELLIRDAGEYGAELDSILAKMKEMVSSGDAFVLGKGNETQVADANNYIQGQKATRKQSARTIVSASADSDVWLSRDYKAKQVELDKILAKMGKIHQEATAMSQAGVLSDTKLKKSNDELKKLMVLARQTGRELKKMAESGKAGNDGAPVTSKDVVPEINAKLANANSLLSSMPNPASRLKKILESAFDGGKKSAKGFLKNLALASTGLIAFSKSGNNSTTVMGKSFKKLWRNFMMFGLGFRSMYYMIKKLRTIAIESLKNMAAQVPSVNTQLSSFMTALNGLKGSLATAFQPILSVVIPILNRVISALTAAANAVGRFFATLTGQKFIYQFTSANVSAAKSLGSTGSAAKKAKKDLDRTLLSFDKMNKLQKNDSGSSGSGGGGGSGADSGAQGTWSKSKNAYSKFADLVKKGWKKGDFTDVGAYIGEQLLSTIDKLEKTFLPKYTEFMNKIGHVTGTLLNGITGTKGLAASIGTFAGTLLNGLIGAVHDFLTSTNFTQLGSFIGEAFGNLVNSIDVGKYLANVMLISIKLVETAVSGVATFMKTVDWSKVGKSLFNGLVSVIQNINVSSLIKSLVTIFSGIPKAVASALYGFLKSAMTTMINNVKQILKDGGYNAGMGLLEGIKILFKSIGTWIKENIIDPIKEGLLSGFQIHSPSKVTQDIGENIGKGLLEGLKSAIENIPNWIKTTGKKLITGALNKITGGDKGIEIKTKFSETKASLSKKWGSLTSSIKDIKKKATLSTPSYADASGKWKTATKDIKDKKQSATISTPDRNTVGRSWADSVGKIKDISRKATLTISATVSNFKSFINNHIIYPFNSKIPKSLKKLGLYINPLAKGGVIPPNREFLAMLGDQTHGVNIETPLETMIDAFNVALAQNGYGNGNVTVVLEGDAKKLFKVVRVEANNYTKSTGKAAFNY